MRAQRGLFGWAAMALLGCAAGTTDDFFKVGELPEETTTVDDSTAKSTLSSGGATSASSSAQVSVTSSGEATKTVDSGAQSSTTGSASSDGSGGDGSGGSGETSQQSASSGGTSAGGNPGAGGSPGDSSGGSSAGGSGGRGGGGGGGGGGGSGGSGSGSGGSGSGSGGTGGQEPVVYVHEFQGLDDCVAVQCPEEAPYLVACDLTFTNFNEDYYCVALEGDGVVFIKSGVTCTAFGSNIVSGSTITCSSEPLESEITTEQCVSNKDDLDLVTDRCDCDGGYYMSGC